MFKAIANFFSSIVEFFKEKYETYDAKKATNALNQIAALPSIATPITLHNLYTNKKLLRKKERLLNEAKNTRYYKNSAKLKVEVKLAFNQIEDKIKQIKNEMTRQEKEIPERKNPMSNFRFSRY